MKPFYYKSQIVVIEIYNVNERLVEGATACQKTALHDASKNKIKTLGFSVFSFFPSWSQNFLKLKNYTVNNKCEIVVYFLKIELNEQNPAYLL